MIALQITDELLKVMCYSQMKSLFMEEIFFQAEFVLYKINCFENLVQRERRKAQY